MGFDQETFAARQAKASSATVPPSYPIADAPAERGRFWGPVLLWPGDEDENWRIGRWNGREWVNDDEIVIVPTHYAPVPDIPAS